MLAEQAASRVLGTTAECAVGFLDLTMGRPEQAAERPLVLTAPEQHAAVTDAQNWLIGTLQSPITY